MPRSDSVEPRGPARARQDGSCEFPSHSRGKRSVGVALKSWQKRAQAQRTFSRRVDTRAAEARPRPTR